MTLIAANQHFVSPLYLTGNQLKPTMRMIVVAIQTAMCMGICSTRLIKSAAVISDAANMPSE
jgi:hypothetical protein